MESPDVILPPDSLVVVTGANGNIGSHIADQLLKYGYRVRGTVRNSMKQQWLKVLFENRYGPAKFELIEVPDMAPRGAFDEAVKGASAFIHTAAPIFVSANPHEVIPSVVDGTVHALESAAKEPGLIRFILTSSSGACLFPVPNKVVTIDSETWNEASVEAAYQPPPYEGMRRKMDVYYASKTKSEQAAWSWVKEHDPPFVLNTVLPNTNFGHVIDAEHQGFHGTLGWIKALFNSAQGMDQNIESQPPQYFVNIQDDAALHVAALIYGDVKNERLFAFADTYSWDGILHILRELYPDRSFCEGFPDQGQDLTTVPNERAEELVRRLTGHGWTSLKATVEQSMQSYGL